MLTKLKKRVQEMLSSEAKVAHRIGLTPNKVSIIGFLLAMLTGLTYALAYIQPLLLIVVVVLILSSGFCDTLDGILARTYVQTTAFGGFFDSLLDRYADAIIYTGIIIGGLCDPLAGLIALAGSLLVSYSRARAEAIRIKMESIGLAERAERMLILVGATIFAFFWLPSLNIGIIILAILSNLTVIQRAHHVYKTLKNKEKS
jgi:archaetidylinositol phosphate synthase